MAYLRIAEVRAAEQARAFDAASSYDIFLSHSFDDAELIYGVKRMIEDLNLSVYVDWIDDPNLDRSKVTVTSAAVLRKRMKTCSSLVYAHSANASGSVWMPWELGFFDGMKPHRVWILPLVATYDGEFKDQEYLGLYPAVEKLSDLGGDRTKLGFDNVGSDKHQVLLEKATRGNGVYY